MVALLVVVAAVGAFVGLLCRGPNGLFSILTQKRVVARLQREIGEMKDTEALLRSDIRSYQDSAHVKKIAQEQYGMVPKSEPTKNEAPAPVRPSPAKAESGKR
jgi:cell division protein FtsB